jgi:hypothetical protein
MFVALGCLIACPAPVSASAIAQQNFLNAVYEDLLGRPVDPSGLALYSPLLDSGEDFEVAHDVDTSGEYYTDVLGAYYRAYLNRPPDAQGLSVYLPALEGGTTDQEVQEAILGSNEYFNLAADDNATFVNSVFQTLLNRPASPQDVNAFVSQLNSGVTRSQVVASILGTTEYETDEVDRWIQSFLDRAPQPADLSSFVPELQGGVTNETVIAQIVGSPEFFDLAQESLPQSAPEPDTFLPLALGLGFMMAAAGASRRQRACTQTG